MLNQNLTTNKVNSGRLDRPDRDGSVLSEDDSSPTRTRWCDEPNSVREGIHDNRGIAMPRVTKERLIDSYHAYTDKDTFRNLKILILMKLCVNVCTYSE